MKKKKTKTKNTLRLYLWRNFVRQEGFCFFCGVGDVTQGLTAC
jgi:hypothetical protein